MVRCVGLASQNNEACCVRPSLACPAACTASTRHRLTGCWTDLNARSATACEPVTSGPHPLIDELGLVLCFVPQTGTVPADHPPCRRLAGSALGTAVGRRLETNRTANVRRTTSRGLVSACAKIRSERPARRLARDIALAGPSGRRPGRASTPGQAGDRHARGAAGHGRKDQVPRGSLHR